MAPSKFAIIAGVGPGTGASVARRFAAEYAVVLIARNPSKFETLAEEINAKGGTAIGISADVTNEESMQKAFRDIEERLPEAQCAAAVFNAAGGFIRKPFLELTTAEYGSGLETNGKGAFLFSQHALTLLLRSAEKSSTRPPTLIFTSATAAIKANPLMATFASGNFAKRALATSLAKEFAPKGIHVAHAIIDGPIDIPGATDYRKDIPTEKKISPDSIAETYWALHLQDSRCFTFEVDIRTSLEKW